MHQAINRCDGHHVIRQDGVPLTEGLIGRDEQAASLVAMGNQFKEDRGFGLRLFDVAKVINDEQVKAVQLVEQSGQLQLQLSLLQCCTNAVAVKNLARLPSSTIARARAAAKWVFPTPEGPNMRQFTARSSQSVSVASCIKGAGLSFGTWSQSKLETVLAAGSWASCRARWRRTLQRRSISNTQREAASRLRRVLARTERKTTVLAWPDVPRVSQC